MPLLLLGLVVAAVLVAFYNRRTASTRVFDGGETHILIDDGINVLLSER